VKEASSAVFQQLQENRFPAIPTVEGFLNKTVMGRVKQKLEVGRSKCKHVL
jgi:hypothetical protein